MHGVIRSGGWALLLGTLLFAAGPAQAQSTGSLDDRLQRMERDLQMLQRDVYGESRPTPPPVDWTAGEPRDVPRDALGRMDVRLSQLEEELRELTGLVEETRFRIDRMAERLDTFSRDAEFRFQELEQRIGGGGGQPSAAPAGNSAETASPASEGGAAARAGGGEGVLGTLPAEDLERLPEANNAPGQGGAPRETAAVLPPDTDPQEQYQHAFRLLRGGDYDRAEQAFRSFLDRHPDHGLAGNAKYWLGETYYVRGDYERAAITFLEGYQDYHEGNKAADSLLKLALALRSLEKTQEACAALGRLESEFPDASASIKRRAEAERQRLACE